MNAGEQAVTNTQMVCGEIFGLANGFLCEIKEIKKVCEPHEDEEIDQWDYC
jgi:hypothetical protein